jgi:hypothetical protein
VIEQTGFYPGVDGDESRLTIIGDSPSRTTLLFGETVNLPSNPSATHPVLVLIYATSDPGTTTETRDVYDQTAGDFVSTVVDKIKYAGYTLNTAIGTPAADPLLPAGWNPLNANFLTDTDARDQDELILYAVWLPAGFDASTDTVETGDIIDLRYFYRPSALVRRGGLTRDVLISGNPELQTAYKSSNDGTTEASNEEIEFKGFTVEIGGQVFQVGGNTATEYAAFTTTNQYYYPDRSISTAASKENRPLYWYALPPIGLPFSGTEPSYPEFGDARSGLVTVTNAAPGVGTRVRHGTWKLRCGNSLDHEYRVEGPGVFMGSLIRGDVADSWPTPSSYSQILYGSKRIGDKVIITERNSFPDDTSISLSDTDNIAKYGIPLGMQTTWTDEATVVFDLTKTPGSGAMRILPATAKGLTLQTGIQLTDVGGSGTISYAALQILANLLDDTDDDATLHLPAWSILSLPSPTSGTITQTEAVRQTNIVDLPFPEANNLTVFTHGRITSADVVWFISVLGYTEPICS